MKFFYSLLDGPGVSRQNSEVEFVSSFLRTVALTCSSFGVVDYLITCTINWGQMSSC
jgi:hypothetical protein